LTRRFESGRGRLLAEDYSAPTQRARSEFDQWRHQYLGRLRLDAMISRTVVVPDSYLLDGRFFMSSSPSYRQAVVAFDRGESVGKDAPPCA